MTKAEFRTSGEYKKCMDKISNYPKGFEFTIPYYKMSKGQANGIDIVLQDCKKAGLIKSIAIGLTFTGDWNEEKFVRL